MTALVIQNAPNRFVSRTSRQASAVIRMIRSSRVTPGVVDEDVDLAEGLERGLDDGLGGLRLGRVALDRERRRPSASIAATVSAAAAGVALS